MPLNTTGDAVGSAGYLISGRGRRPETHLHNPKDSGSTSTDSPSVIHRSDNLSLTASDADAGAGLLRVSKLTKQGQLDARSLRPPAVCRKSAAAIAIPCATSRASATVVVTAHGSQLTAPGPDKRRRRCCRRAAPPSQVLNPCTAPTLRVSYLEAPDASHATGRNRSRRALHYPITTSAKLDSRRRCCLSLRAGGWHVSCQHVSRAVAV